MATRRALLALRDAMSPEARAAASTLIGDAAIALLAQRLAPGDVLALYVAKGSEVDTTRIDDWARRAGMRVVYPRVVASDRKLEFHEVERAALALSRFGLLEASADAPTVALDDIAAFAVPGLGFDRAGGRIGWGRGHYDATFAATAGSALRVGLAFECQVVDQVAREAHDIALHVVITERAVHGTSDAVG